MAERGIFDRVVLIGAGRTSGGVAERLARIAPLTVIDLSPAALEALAARLESSTAARDALGRDALGRDVGARDVASGGVDNAGGLHRIITQVGDGTSRLVLSDLRGDPKSSVALVVATGDDRAALETCEFASGLGYAPIVAVVSERAVADQCEAKYRARALVRADLVGELVEQSLMQGGLGIASSGAVGFSRGEIFEFTVLPSSPAIGVPLARLHAEGWRIAAIYRGSELVLPTGTTRIAVEDRVLVVGDARQLPHVAESLRVGLPTFPLLHGPNIVIYLPAGRDGGVETEAEVLTARTRAAQLVRVYPNADNEGLSKRVIETPLPDGTIRRKHFRDASIDPNASLADHLKVLRSKKPGVVMTRARKRTFMDVVLGRGGLDSELCNEIGVPVLYPRGSSEYERIILCLTNADENMPAMSSVSWQRALVSVGEIALDLARMFNIPLLMVQTKLPAYLQGSANAPAAAAAGAADAGGASPAVASDFESAVDTIIRRAKLHHVKPEIITIEGNPIREWSRVIQPPDLAVIPRMRTTHDSFSRPDLALRLIRKSRGSVLVVTLDEG